MKKKICFIINSLNIGGTETMLYRLISRIDKKQFEIYLVSLTGEGKLSLKFSTLNITILYLDLKKLFSFALSLYRLYWFLKNNEIDIVQTWLSHSDLIGGFLAKLSKVPNISWSLRNNKLSKNRSKFLTRLSVKICVKLSYWIPKNIICCGDSVKKTYIALGYNKSIMKVIYNGFDTNEFKKDIGLRINFRNKFPWHGNKLWVGFLGRNHPDKGVAIFVDAAKKIIESRNDIIFLLAGVGLDKPDFKSGINNIIFLGEVQANQYLNALDIFVSSSLTEGFSNAIGEAMACELPCIVTDTGDSGFLLNHSEFLVDTNNSNMIAEKIIQLANIDPSRREEIGKKLRFRIKRNFDIDSVVYNYLSEFM